MNDQIESTSAPLGKEDKMYVHGQHIAQLLERSNQFVTKADFERELRFLEQRLSDKFDKFWIGVALAIFCAIGGWIYSVYQMTHMDESSTIYIVSKEALQQGGKVEVTPVEKK